MYCMQASMVFKKNSTVNAITELACNITKAIANEENAPSISWIYPGLLIMHTTI